MRFESGDGRRIESNTPGSVGLRVFFNESVGAGFGNGPAYGQGPVDEIQVCPTKAAELSPPAPGRCGHEHQTSEVGIALLEVHQDPADVIQARGSDFSGPERRAVARTVGEWSIHPQRTA